MKTMFGPLASMLLVVASAGAAQSPLVVGATASTTLHQGLQVPLRTLVELSTMNKTLLVGQRVPLEVAEAVSLNGQIIIPVGTPAVGEITAVRNKGMWGKSGSFSGRVVSIRVGDREIHMTGSFDDKGHAGGGAAVAASAIVFLPAGFFMTGTSARLPIGAPVSGFLAEDVPVVLGATPAAAVPLRPVSAQPAATTLVSATAPATLPRK